MRSLKRSDRLIARNRREIIQEVVQALSPLQVIDQVAQRDARAYKDWGAAKDFRVAVHHLVSACNGVFHPFRILAQALYRSYRAAHHSLRRLAEPT